MHNGHGGFGNRGSVSALQGRLCRSGTRMAPVPAPASCVSRVSRRDARMRVESESESE